MTEKLENILKNAATIYGWPTMKGARKKLRQYDISIQEKSDGKKKYFLALVQGGCKSFAVQQENLSELFFLLEVFLRKFNP